jgi:hypothetical protein
MDDLEEYIMKHREELDGYKPSSGIRKRLGKSLGTDKNSVFRLLSIAAMITVILGSAVLFLRPGFNQSGRSLRDNNNRMNPQTGFHLKETEIYYNNLATSLYAEAIPMLAGKPEIQKELSMDLSQIDSICGEIKKDLKDNIANRDVVEALIQNYRIKIRILEDMLKMLKESEGNTEKRNNHEL